MSAEEQASEAPFSLGVFTEANLTFYLYRWCVSVVSTRINIVPSKKKDGKTPPMIPALIPFVDFANHEYTREENPTTGSVYFDGETREIHLQIHRNLRKDDEVLIHYGVRSNSEVCPPNIITAATACKRTHYSSSSTTDSSLSLRTLEIATSCG